MFLRLQAPLRLQDGPRPGPKGAAAAEGRAAHHLAPPPRCGPLPRRRFAPMTEPGDDADQPGHHRAVPWTCHALGLLMRRTSLAPGSPCARRQPRPASHDRCGPALHASRAASPSQTIELGLFPFAHHRSTPFCGSMCGVISVGVCAAGLTFPSFCEISRARSAAALARLWWPSRSIDRVVSPPGRTARPVVFQRSR
jgi:hypothetical protein